MQYLDREILDSVAREAGVPAASVAAIEERAGRLARLMRLLGARPKLPTVASPSLREQKALEARVEALMERDGLSRYAAFVRLESSGGLEYVPRRDYLDLVTSVMLEYTAQGQAMIVGRGGQLV